MLAKSAITIGKKVVSKLKVFLIVKIIHNNSVYFNIIDSESWYFVTQSNLIADIILRKTQHECYKFTQRRA